MTIISPTEMEDFNRILAQHGCTKDDFELTGHEDPLPASGEVAPVTGHPTVKHRESGVERTYKAGHGTAWVVEFENDLNAKAFTIFSRS